jgi:hypothetical protein
MSSTDGAPGDGESSPFSPKSPRPAQTPLSTSLLPFTDELEVVTPQMLTEQQLLTSDLRPLEIDFPDELALTAASNVPQRNATHEKVDLFEEAKRKAQMGIFLLPGKN